MNKNSYLFTYLVIASLLTPASASAYYISMDIGTAGVVTYSYPSVLGDEDKPEEKKEEKKEEKREEKREEKKEEKREDKPSRVEPRPEKIEIRKVENKTNVKLIKQDKVRQELSPEKVSLKFSAVPKVTPTSSLKKDDLAENEIENEVENENEDLSDGQKELRKTIKDRSGRKDEKVEIQSEVHDDGTVELQLESRDVKAKIKNGEIEVDVKNNNIGSSDNSGIEKKLIHLPDQALQRFIDKGMSTVPDTLEVGESGVGYEYSITATKKEKLFGLIPRVAKYKLTLDDQNGVVSEQKVNSSVVERLLNIFSF
ncbi:hypothetical protein HYV64_00905 [Candidatus Shapirobacteria bacterium]|nr:hypothetical protein [Candidatus Shapirobacteria bacterium]